MPSDAAHYDVETHFSRIVEQSGTPIAKVVPLVRRVDRAAIGFLADQIDLSDDWDSLQTNAEIAADFGLAERACCSTPT